MGVGGSWGGGLTTKCGVLVYIVARAAGARGPCLLAGRLPALLVLDHLSAQRGSLACAAQPPPTSPGPEDPIRTPQVGRRSCSWGWRSHSQQENRNSSSAGTLTYVKSEVATKTQGFVKISPTAAAPAWVEASLKSLSTNWNVIPRMGRITD